MRKIKFKSKTAAVLAVILSVAAALLAVNYCITAKYARIAKEQAGGVADYRLVLAVIRVLLHLESCRLCPIRANG